MFTTFSPDVVLGQTLKRLGMSISTFWALSDGTVSRTYIEKSLNKTRELSQTEAARLLQLAKELDDLQASFPCRLDWSDLRGIGAALARRREQVEQEEFLKKQRDRIKEIEEIEPY